MTKMISRLAVALTCSVCMVGCGGGGPVTTTLEQNAYAQIEGLSDAAGSEQMFSEAFVSGAAPSNREEYAKRGYQVIGEATMEGETATVPIQIFGGVSNSQAGDRDAGNVSEQTSSEQVWTLQRVSDEWKIKDAPLG